MSRCFPFPPPGYEKKPTTDDADLLKKEKHKEKKHKKDKKDREKREGKEKKDRSEGKHRDKKDKKDKHKDKKKDKEKSRSNYSDQKKVESYNGETLHQNNEHNNQKEGYSGHKKSSNGEHRVLLLRKEESCKENFNSSNDKKSSAKLWGQNEEFLVQNRVEAEDIDNSKFVQELGRRIRDEEKGTSSLQFPIESRKASVERGEILKMDRTGITNEVATFGRLVMVQNMVDGTMPSLDKMREKENDDKQGDKRKSKHRHGRDKDKEKDRTKEEKVKKKSEFDKTERDKNKYMKNGDTIGSFKDLSTHSPNVGLPRAGYELKKRKDMETNGFCHENEPRPNKMARPTSSSILTENGRKQDFLQNQGSSLAGKPIDSFKVDGKERRANGVISPQPTTPASKKPPITTVVNHILNKPTTIKPQPVSIDHVATQRSPIPTTKPPSSVPNHMPTQPFPEPSTKPSPANKVAAAQPLPNSKKKPPHPDTKYLKQILTVPKLEEWCGVDDQEWLSKDDPHFKKTTRDDALREVEVWSEAKHLESVDICALPYVIPY